MKVIILCGGLGSRLLEKTHSRPKPMVKIGNKPILSHITDIYERNGFKEFILALGYKSHFIKKYYSKRKSKSKIYPIYTGKNTLTGGRLLRLKKYFNKGENFMLTYGDGLTNQNLKKLLNFHLKHKKIATMTVVRPPVRFGQVKLSKNKIKSFKEKTQSAEGWINGGFFVFNYKIFDFIKGDQIMLEKEPMQKLAKIGQLIAFKHTGFWQCMDTMREKKFLDNLYRQKKAPWTR